MQNYGKKQDLEKSKSCLRNQFIRCQKESLISSQISKIDLPSTLPFSNNS